LRGPFLCVVIDPVGVSPIQLHELDHSVGYFFN